uniref:Orf166 n=1 Tax=Monoblepharella sp. JEL15 TaxID=224130 RepID=Q85MC0_9FUNG|nr:orf166 [Monoblepharella sp. JEL15]AAO64962.1 orf166 [Monoblepharella sp. JEL15]
MGGGNLSAPVCKKKLMEMVYTRAEMSQMFYLFLGFGLNLVFNVLFLLFPVLFFASMILSWDLVLHSDLSISFIHFMQSNSTVTDGTVTNTPPLFNEATKAILDANYPLKRITLLLPPYNEYILPMPLKYIPVNPFTSPNIINHTFFTLSPEDLNNLRLLDADIMLK